MTLAERLTQAQNAIDGLTALANATTKAGDSNITDAISSLIAGYGGGGLPDGIKEISFGVIVHPTDSSYMGSGQKVAHGLSSRADAVVMLADGFAFSTTSYVTSAYGIISADTISGRSAIAYLNASGNATFAGTQYDQQWAGVGIYNAGRYGGINPAVTEAEFSYSGYTSKFKAGVPYRWIAIALDRDGAI